MDSRIKNVAIIGSGVMGLGIAQSCAMHGYQVQLYDSNKKALSKAILQIEKNLKKGVELGKLSLSATTNTLANIFPINSLGDIKADLVIEAIIEDLKAKQELFAELEKLVSPTALLASNTSSISITQIAAGLKHRQRFLGIHFFNPAHLMKLVEVISTDYSAKLVIDMALEFTKSLDKTPVKAKDAPGFIVNRVARHFYVESLLVMEEGVASFEEIDALVEATGFRMGPFRLMDLIGIDTNFAVTSTIYEGFHQHPKFRPSRIQQQKVLAGQLGKKSGKGFYLYE